MFAHGAECSEIHYHVNKKIAFHYLPPKVGLVSKKLVPMSLRLSEEMNQRLERAAADVRQKKHTLAQLAIEAAVEAIEDAGGKIVIPVKFDVSQTPTARLSSAKIETHANEIFGAAGQPALNETHGATSAPPVQGAPPASGVHYGKAKRKPSKRKPKTGP